VIVLTLIVEPTSGSGTLDDGVDSGVRDWEYLWLGLSGVVGVEG
jgi:hypothetical protein